MARTKLRSVRTARIRSIAGLVLGLAVAGTVVAAGTERSPAQASPNRNRVRLTLIKVWVSRRDNPAPCPKQIARYEKLLRKVTPGKNSFRLEGAPVEKSLERDEKSTFKLAEGYTLSLTPQLEKGKRKWTLKYQLARKDWVSDLRIPLATKRKPNVVKAPIHKGDEQLVLILVCAPPS